MSENNMRTSRTSLRALAMGLLLHPWADAVAQFGGAVPSWSDGEKFAFFVAPWIGLCAVAGVLVAIGAHWRKASLHALWRAALLFLGAEALAFLIGLLSTKMSTAALLAYVFFAMGYMFSGIVLCVMFLLFLLFPYVLSKCRATRLRKNRRPKTVDESADKNGTEIRLLEEAVIKRGDQVIPRPQSKHPLHYITILLTRH